MKFSIKDFFSKFDQVRSFLRITLHLLKKSLMENFIFCAVFKEKLDPPFPSKKLGSAYGVSFVERFAEKKWIVKNYSCPKNCNYAKLPLCNLEIFRWNQICLQRQMAVILQKVLLHLVKPFNAPVYSCGSIIHRGDSWQMLCRKE